MNGNVSEPDPSGESESPGAASEPTPASRPPVVIDWGTFPHPPENIVVDVSPGGEAPARETFDPRAVMTLAVIGRLRGLKGVYVAPNVPERVVAAASQAYLTLGHDELLLAVIDSSAGAVPQRGFALTCRRLCWFDREVAAEIRSSSLDAGPGQVGGGLAGGVSLDFARVPNTIRVEGRIFPEIELSDGWGLPSRGLDRKAMAVLVEVIRDLARASISGDFSAAATPQALEQARQDLGRIGQQAAAIRRNVVEHRSFYEFARTATPRVVVTPLVMVACLAVTLLIMLQQGTPADPDVDTLFRWGGVSGMSVVLDHEYWRLLTGMFLHGGLLHLALNLWCLGRLGPLIERLYGNGGFALLYVLSGLGGSLASAWWHPLVVGVGASGAIFGILGGLLAFLTVHRHAIPASVFGPLRSSTLSFVVFNAGFGLLSTEVDNAAHLGGLASGFIAGMLLSRPWPARGPFDGLTHQVLRSIPLLILIGLAGLAVNDRVRNSAEVVETIRAFDAPRVAYNDLLKALNPGMLQFDAVNHRLDELLGHQKTDPLNDPRQIAELDRLIAETSRGQSMVKSIATPDADLDAARREILAAQGALLQALRSLKAAVVDDDPKRIDGAGGYKDSMDRLARNVESFHDRCRGYLKKHQLAAGPE